MNPIPQDPISFVVTTTSFCWASSNGDPPYVKRELDVIIYLMYATEILRDLRMQAEVHVLRYFCWMVG